MHRVWLVLRDRRLLAVPHLDGRDHRGSGIAAGACDCDGNVEDECGVWHASGHFYRITLWEVYNEPVHEHYYTKESYVQDFDAIVRGIRRWADPEKKIRFVGMNLENIVTDDQLADWTAYFANASNHAPDCRDALSWCTPCGGSLLELRMRNPVRAESDASPQALLQ